MYHEYLIGFICGVVVSMIMAMIISIGNHKPVDRDTRCAPTTIVT